ncbi:hypothetical protein ABK040_004223 [Willaertia magna]
MVELEIHKRRYIRQEIPSGKLTANSNANVQGVSGVNTIASNIDEENKRKEESFGFIKEQEQGLINPVTQENIFPSEEQEFLTATEAGLGTTTGQRTTVRPKESFIRRAIHDTQEPIQVSIYSPITTFYGPVTSFLSMIFLPLTVYYLWICVTFHRGRFIYPKNVDEIGVFFRDQLWAPITIYASPSLYTFTIYSLWLLWNLTIHVLAPGPFIEGPLLGDGLFRPVFKLNAYFSMICTACLVTFLHATGLFRLTELYENFGSLLTTSIIYSFFLSLAVFLYTTTLNLTENISGSFIYDFFEGSSISYNRIGKFDFKFWFYLFPGKQFWLLLSVSMALKQIEIYGSVTWTMLLLNIFYFSYSSAMIRNENALPLERDMKNSKLGWFNIWNELVWIPFVYSLHAMYILHNQRPRTENEFELKEEGSWLIYCTVLHFVGYYIWEVAKRQWTYFKERENGIVNASVSEFPNLTVGSVEFPRFIEARNGRRLLAEGCWLICRHLDFTSELIMFYSWGLICGFHSLIPYFIAFIKTLYFIYKDRTEYVDNVQKYGDDWIKYCRLVPYSMVPYIY